MILGLVTTKSAELERAEELKPRISQAARYLPLERLGLSPQCGFASSVIGNAVSPGDQRRKLELLVRIARAIWH